MKRLKLYLTALGACFALGASAQRGSCGTNVSWVLENGTLTISGDGNMSDFVSPQYSNLPSWYIYKDNITKVIVEGGVRHVGDYAFYGYTNLKEVIFEEGVKSIGGYAFYNCEGIKELQFPASMEVISGRHDEKKESSSKISTRGLAGDGTASKSSNAFYGCNGLTHVIIPKDVVIVGTNTFRNCLNLKSVTWNVANYPSSYGFAINLDVCFENYSENGSPFSGCPLTDFTFGNEVDSIPGGLLYGQSELANITFSGKTEFVGKDAFWGTKWYQQLADGMVYIDQNAYSYKGYMQTPTEIIIPEGIRTITEGAFANQTYLTKVTIPSTLTSMESQVFDGCRSLGEIIWNAEDCKIGYSRYGIYEGSSLSQTALYSIIFGPKVRNIPRDICYNCPYITDVTLPESVTSIGSEAFSYCSGLENVHFSNNIKEIQGSAFSNCSKLSDIVLPDSLQSIGNYAFKGCTALKKITIPEKVELIDVDAFDDTHLETVIFNAKNCTINSTDSYSPTFPNTITHLEIGDQVQSIPYNLCKPLTELTSLKVGRNVQSMPYNCFSASKKLASVEWNAVNMEEANTPFASTLTQISFGKDVERIPSALCKGLEQLSSVVLPDSLKEIGESAFYGSGITSIQIPEEVRAIETGTFSYCESLKEITLNPEIETLGRSAFYKCTALEEINIPNNVDSIGSSAFSNCTALTSVTIPDRVRIIEENAFAYCSQIKDLSIGKGVQEIGSNAFNNCSALDSVYWNAENYLKENNILPQGFSKITFGKDVKRIPARICLNNSNLVQVNMADHIETIGESAFNGCSSLKNIEIPVSLKNIGSSAFAYTGLSSLFIPSTVESLDSYAFANNENLEQVILVKDPFKHPYGLFSNCNNLKAIYLPDGMNFYQNYEWSIYGDKIKSMVTFEDTYVYSGKNIEMVPSYQMPEGYEIKDWTHDDAPKDAGEYDLSNSFTVEGPHPFNFDMNLHCLIQPKDLLVKTKDYRKLYGEKNPEFELEYEGFVEGEDASVLTELPVAFCDATEESDAYSAFQIIISGGSAQNYLLNYDNYSILYIDPAKQSITWEQNLSNLHIGDEVVLEGTSTSGEAVIFELNEEDEDKAAIEYSDDDVFTLKCLKAGTITITAYLYNMNSNYEYAEPVIKTLTIQGTVGINNNHTDLLKVFGGKGNIIVSGLKNEDRVRVHTLDGTLLYDKESTETTMQIPVNRSGIYLVQVNGKIMKISVK